MTVGTGVDRARDAFIQITAPDMAVAAVLVTLGCVTAFVVPVVANRIVAWLASRGKRE